MNVTQVYLITAIGYALIIATGLWTSSLGRPINVVVNTLHKLVSLGTAVYVGVMLSRAHKLAPLTSGDVGLIVLSGACFVVMLATGGMLSSEKQWPGIVLLLHRIVPVLSALSTGYMLYTIAGR